MPSARPQRPHRPKTEASESHVLVASAFELARELQIPNLLVLADLLGDRREVEKARDGESVIWLIRDPRDEYPEIPEDDPCIELPSAALGRFDQVKLGMILAVLRGQVGVDESVVCLTGVAGSKRLDMVVIMNSKRDFPWFRQQRRPRRFRGPLVSREFGRLLEIAVRLASEGREGKRIGTIFVLGKTKPLEPYVHQLIFNPCRGHPRRVRNIHNPEFLETIRELAALDGAFIVDDRGVVERAAAYLDAPSEDGVRVRRGLGARHVAAAAITARTSAVAIVISESSSTVTVFAKGAALIEIERAAEI